MEFVNGTIVLNIGELELSFPLEIWILIGVAIIYAVLLVVCFLRRFCLVCRGDPVMAVHRYTEIFMMWLLMLIHTTVYASSIIAIVQFSLNDSGCQDVWVPIFGIVAFVLIATLFGSTVDVLVKFKMYCGPHKPDVLVFILTLLGVYQINCVWEMSGHIESHTEDKLTCCFLCVTNQFQPSVKNAKDLVVIQGIVQSIPVAIVLLGSYMLLPCGEWSLSVIISLVTACLSALVAIMLVDWDAAHTDYKLSFGRGFLIYLVLSLIKRAVELVGVVLYFTYFFMIQGWFVLLLLAVNWLVTALTQLDLAEASGYSRTAKYSNTAYLSFGAIFFGFFKRIAVDKVFIGAETTMMPASFELFRYVMKFIIFIGAFFASFSSGVAPDLNLADNFGAAILTWGSLVCYGLLAVIVLIEFLCFRRKQLKRADCKLWFQWCKSDSPCSCLFAPNRVVINKDMATNQDGMVLN